MLNSFKLSLQYILPKLWLTRLAGWGASKRAGWLTKLVIDLFVKFYKVDMKADKVVMESTLSFARSLTTNLAQDPTLTLQSVYLFWTMIDRRERTPLYDRYEAVIRKLGLSLMTTHIPYRSKFNKELLADNTGVGRSTLLAPARTFACEAQLEILTEEILTLLKIR